MDFSVNGTFFLESNYVRVSQNIHDKALLKRSVFADLNAHQFINLNGKLNGSREKNMHRSIWNGNDQSSCGRVDGLPDEL